MVTNTFAARLAGCDTLADVVGLGIQESPIAEGARIARVATSSVVAGYSRFMSPPSVSALRTHQ